MKTMWQRLPVITPTRWRVLLMALAILAGAVLVSGCEPRRIVPTKPALLVRPERDVVEYRKLVLPNRLKVLLVSNPQADDSAAAMSVAVGSLDDPAERPGMVHFLEHMLFLGTEKYPQVNGYTQFLSSHGGGSNAYTADDHTNFFFSVDHAALPEALDRFAQFFVAPLLDQTYTDREMNAVDSEHAKNLESDGWRTRQVQRLQFDADHPIRRFSTGNLQTLSGITRDEFLRFYRRHYSSNVMALSVVGNADLDTLETLVRERFAAIPDRDAMRPAYPTQYLAPKAALRVVRLQPVADQRQLNLHFPLPPMRQHYDARPLQIVSSILGHEGRGSLLSLLKAEGLVHSLSAGGSESTADYSSFEVNVGLTPKGLQHYREVIRQVLGAIAGLRAQGIPRYVFEEDRIMSELEQRFREIPPSGSMARRLSAMMLSYPLEALPDEVLILRRYAPELYAQVLDHLRPDNMLATLVAQGLPTDQVEPFYQARYGYEELTGEPYAALVDAAPPADWHLPEPNPFIPKQVALNDPQGPLRLAGVSRYHLKDDGLPEAILERFEPLFGQTFVTGEAYVTHLRSLMSLEEQRRWLPMLVEDAQPVPVRLLNTEQASIWYQPDWRFRQPKAEIVLKFFVDGAFRSPREAVLAALYESAVEEGLNEVGYPIREAGLGYGLRDVKGGIVLSLSGYSARMVELLDFLVGRLRQVDVNETTFSSLKERQRRGLVNQRLDQPYRQASYFLRLLLEEPNFTREALLEALEPLTLADVQAYARRFLERTYVEGVVVGNLPREEARAAVAGALAKLSAGVLPPEARVDAGVRALPRRADWVFSDRLAVNNSLVHLYYQIGPRDPELSGALALISQPLRERFYHQMRTEQQLGYIVWAGASEMHRTLTMSFLVQSGQYPADELRKRIEAFLPGFVADYRVMPDAEFEQYRTVAIRSLLERAEGLSEVAQGLHWAAFRNDGRFDYVSDQVAALERLTRADVEAVLARYLEGPDARRVAIRLIGSGHEAGPPRGQAVSLPKAVQAKAG